MVSSNTCVDCLPEQLSGPQDPTYSPSCITPLPLDLNLNLLRSSYILIVKLGFRYRNNYFIIHCSFYHICNGHAALQKENFQDSFEMAFLILRYKTYPQVVTCRDCFCHDSFLHDCLRICSNRYWKYTRNRQVDEIQ